VERIKLINLMGKTDTMTRLLFCLLFFMDYSMTARSQEVYQEPFRPQIHFSPKTGWMNDPNGMVFYQGEYHLFFQFYPDSTVWGPMHWGHAISKDLMHWKQAPIALYPDSLGYIFSGSAVVDERNTSGMGTNEKIPLVALYTQHDPKGEKAGTNHFQNQSMAYSLDAGGTWTKYSGNPVLRSPGFRDFRDPKVSWYPDQNKWIMTLATGDRIQFFSSVNLKTWSKESEFGVGIGAHGGVWECPDLIPFDVDGKKIWLLLVSINPGGVQGGSGVQYFTGTFDGHRFSSADTLTRWADYGPDDYAGVTFSNTGREKIYMGWMSNWQYGTSVPAGRWRSAMTIPRLLNLKNVGGSYFITMMPVDALEKLVNKSDSYKHIPEVNEITFSGPTRFEISLSELYSFSLVFSNASGQNVKAGYDEEKNAFFIDRTQAGRSEFNAQFANIYYAPRIDQSNHSKIILILDNTSLEMFADEGLSTITEVFFPDQPFNQLQQGASRKPVEDIRISQLSSIWPSGK
jgi:fructan beta-fructosidase